VKREYAVVALVAVAQAAAKVGAGILMIKALAVTLGPADLAYFGQLHGVYLLFAGAAAVFLGTGLVAALARHVDRPVLRAATLRAADRATVVLVVALAAGGSLAWAALGRDWRSVVIHADLLAAVAAVGVVSQVLYTRSLSLLTAGGEVSRFGFLSTGYALATAACVAGAATVAGLAGSVVGLATASVVGALAGGLLLRGRWSSDTDAAKQDGLLREILALGAFGLVGALAPQVCLIAVRAILIEGVSAEAAGMWHGMSRLSDAILGPVVTIISLYLLPRYAKVGLAGSGATLMQAMASLALPFGLVALLVWAQRDAVIRLAFTVDFAPMAQMFSWQLAGDVVRVLSWLFAYCLLGAGLTGWLVGLELSHVAVYIGLVAVLVPGLQEAAGSVGYLAANSVYLAAVAGLYAVKRRRASREVTLR
jgi:antigen flippase